MLGRSYASACACRRFAASLGLGFCGGGRGYWWWKGVGWVRRYQCGVLLRLVHGRGWCDVHSPEARAGGFSLAMQNGCAVAIVDHECLFCEEGGTVGVTQLP